MTLDDTVAAWDRIAGHPTAAAAIHPTGIDPVSYRASGEAAAGILADLIGPDDGRPIIDFGAGTGRVTLPLTDLYTNVIAVDSSATMLTELEARAYAAGYAEVPATLIRSDGTDGNLTDLRGAARAVITLATLIHHAHADTTRIVTELIGLLAPDGILIADLGITGHHHADPAAWNQCAQWTYPDVHRLAEALDVTVAAIVEAPLHYVILRRRP